MFALVSLSAASQSLASKLMAAVESLGADLVRARLAAGKVGQSDRYRR